MSNYDIGTLPSNGSVVTRNDYSLTLSDLTDTFEFRIGTTSNINLALTGISAGDDADLTLYRDNGNGYFDSGDTYVTGSSRSGNADDSINLADQSVGTYFAQVNRYSSSVGNVTYDLAFSTDDPSNLLPIEDNLGNLSGDVTRTGSVNNSDTSDVYSFSLGLYEGVNIRLTGLSADADIRLIQDYNGDRNVDSGEVIRSSTNGGSASELISGIDLSGSYYLQVYQYSGNTNYTVTFDRFATIDA